MLGVNDDTRTLSYRVRKLSLVDERGRELVLYSRRKAWLLLFSLPALFLWKFLLTNHYIPFSELWKNAWNPWGSVKKFLSGK